ncbi:MAG: BrnA antitoxin family protein [Magnetococcus sp. DMHC-6]
MNGKLSVLETDWSKVDAHLIQPEEYEELPEWTEEMFDAADIRIGDKLIRRGRPIGSGTKISTTVRLDADIIAAFRTSGKGWQTRMNNALRDWLASHSSA